MHDEIVVRRKWLTEQQFLDLLGATNLIPGPNSTEMAIHIGFAAGRLARPDPRRRRASSCPAMAIVMALAWAYVRFGTTAGGHRAAGRGAARRHRDHRPGALAARPQGRQGPAHRRSLRPPRSCLALLGVNELLLLAAGGVLGMVVYNWRRKAGLPAIALRPLPPRACCAAAGAAVPFTLATLFWTFLKIGAVLYGSGYVLIAFLRADFVERLGWLTETQLLDAVAVGQVTPGPLFTTATFIGYILGGVPGGVLATVGIFLPAFVFVAISNPLIPRLRASPWTAGFLDSVNAASLGLMAAVTAQLAYGSFRSPAGGRHRGSSPRSCSSGSRSTRCGWWRCGAASGSLAGLS